MVLMGRLLVYGRYGGVLGVVGTGAVHLKAHGGHTVAVGGVKGDRIRANNGGRLDAVW